MKPSDLDFIFPFFVFAYGAIMTFTLNNDTLMKLAERRLPLETVTSFRGHRHIGVISLLVGAVWSLQNILLSH